MSNSLNLESTDTICKQILQNLPLEVIIFDKKSLICVGTNTPNNNRDVIGNRFFDIFKNIEDRIRVEIAIECNAQTFNFNSWYTISEKEDPIHNECMCSIVSYGTKKFISVVVIDVTGTKKQKEAYHKLAFFDTLTGLPNRLHFNKKSKEYIKWAKTTGSKFAIILIDIDNFKFINDSRGHIFGDKYLIEIGNILERIVGIHCEVELNCSCFCSRLGGDEFVFLIDGIDSMIHAKEAVEAIFSMFKKPINIDGVSIVPSMSAGISLYPNTSTTITGLLKAADLAMYAAKNEGKNRYTFYSEEMNELLRKYVEIEQLIQRILITKNFHMKYQPLLSVENNEVIGVEALFKGNLDINPNIEGADIIKVAEETGKIVELGTLILDKVLEESLVLLDSNPELIISVNISIKQLKDPKIYNVISESLKRFNFPTKNLMIEITETVFMSNFKDNLTKINMLKDLGIRVAIDDFGTGYSSMTYLKMLPVDLIKTDMSFISDIIYNKKTLQIMNAITDMTEALNINSLAEGVENTDQLTLLKDIKCDAYQGFLSSKPLFLKDIIDFIKSEKKI
jgi:diguanylate cyclase (GGDEF)-like protein